MYDRELNEMRKLRIVMVGGGIAGLKEVEEALEEMDVARNP